MAWKQPIPTGLESVFGDDYASMLLYKELIYRAANSDGYFTDKRGKTVAVKRGQTVYGRNQFCKYLATNPSQFWDRKLEKLEKTYKLVNKQASNNFTLVDLINYNELVRFEQANEQAVNKQRTSNEQAMNTSKSVETVETGRLEDSNSYVAEATEATEGIEEMKSLWRTHTGTQLRNHLEENLKAYTYLKGELHSELPNYLSAVRMLRADHYQKRTLQAKLINYAGLRDRLEEVEAYMQGRVDTKIIGEPIRI